MKLEKPVDRKKYTREYYLTDCNGYDLFLESGGMKLPERFKVIYEKIFLGLGKQDRVLDIGCGRGELSAAMAPYVDSIVGVDYSDDAIKISKEVLEKKFKNLCLLVADAKSLPFPDNSFDLVVCTEVIEHLHGWEQEKMLAEIARVLSPEGRFIAQTEPNRIFRYISSVWSFFPRLISAIINRRKIRFLLERPSGHLELHVKELSFWGVKVLVEKYFFKNMVEMHEMVLGMNLIGRFFFNGYPLNRLPFLERFFNREIIICSAMPIKVKEK